MAQYLINGDILTDIADSIRSGKGSTDGIYPTEFAEEITTLIDRFCGVIDRSTTDIVIPNGAMKISANLFREAYTISSVIFNKSDTIWNSNA